MSVLTMRLNSPRYGQACATCGQRVRAGKQFQVDPVESKLIRHRQCAVPLTAK